MPLQTRSPKYILLPSVKTQNLSVDADAEANSNEAVQEKKARTLKEHREKWNSKYVPSVDVEANLRKFAKLCDTDCAQNFATVISWLGALGLFVGFLLFPSNLEEERIYVLLASLIILLFSVTFKVFHRNVECC